MFQVEQAHQADLSHIAHLQLKTQEFPLLIDELRPYFTENNKFVFWARIADTKVGHVLLTIDRRERKLLVDSIGVLPLYRRKGAGLSLMNKVDLFASGEGLEVRALVPSYQVDDPDDPDHVEHFFWRCGMQAVGVADEPCLRYNQEYDFYVFEKRPGGEDVLQMNTAAEMV